MIESLLGLVCAQEGERCACVAGHAMPVCARCAGILVGALIGTVLVCARRLGDPGRREAMLWCAAIVGGLGVIAVEHGLGRPIADGWRAGTAALAAFGGAILAVPVFTRRVLERGSRPSRDPGWIASAAALAALALPLSQWLAFDFVTPLAAIGLAVFAVTTASIVVRVLIAPAWSKRITIAAATALSTAALLLAGLWR